MDYASAALAMTALLFLHLLAIPVGMRVALWYTCRKCGAQYKGTPYTWFFERCKHPIAKV
jgi:hypothetical protein